MSDPYGDLVTGYGVSRVTDPEVVHVNLYAERWVCGANMKVRDAHNFGRMLLRVPDSPDGDAEILRKAAEILARRHPQPRPRSIRSVITSLLREVDG